LSAITCPLEEDEEEEEEANSGLASDRVVGIRIADRKSREHGSDDTPCFTAAGPFINHGFRIFHAADAVADRDSAGELAAVFGLARQLTMSDAVDADDGMRRDGKNRDSYAFLSPVLLCPPRAVSPSSSFSLSIYFFTISLFLSPFTTSYLDSLRVSYTSVLSFLLPPLSAPDPG